MAQQEFKLKHRPGVGKYEDIKTLLFERLSQRAIAKKLGIARSTVYEHTQNIRKEFNISNSNEDIVVAAFKHYNTIINQLKEELAILKARPDTKIEYVYKTVEVVKEIKIPAFTLPTGANQSLT